MPTTVMVITPLEPLREALESMLGTSGFSVIQGAANINQVRLFLNAQVNTPDVAIVDLCFPQKTITGFIQTLIDRRISVVFMGVEGENEEFARRMGIPFLTKPFPKAALAANIKVALGKQKRT
ncbi:MAG: hypothetical protein ACFFDP_00560 [Promethearchaeota archaeon]